MLHRILLEVTVAAALVIAIAALVVAIQNGGSEATPESVANVPANAAEESVVNDAREGGEDVRLMALSFLPDEVRVEAGTPVVWRNLDQTAHDVTASDGSWGSELMGVGDTFEMTFDEPGAYVYICTLHPPRGANFFGAPDGTRLAGGGLGMQGTIIVE